MHYDVTGLKSALAEVKRRSLIGSRTRAAHTHKCTPIVWPQTRRRMQAPNWLPQTRQTRQTPVAGSVVFWWTQICIAQTGVLYMWPGVPIPAQSNSWVVVLLHGVGFWSIQKSFNSEFRKGYPFLHSMLDWKPKKYNWFNFVLYTDVCIALYVQCFPSVCEKNSQATVKIKFFTIFSWTTQRNKL